MKPVLVVGEFTPDQRRLIDAEFRCLEAGDLHRDGSLAAGVGGILTRSNITLGEEMLDGLPGLAVIATVGVGYDGIPLDYARRRGIVVTNTPRLLDGAVSELAVGMLLGLLRQIPAADRFVRDGRWPQGGFPWGASLEGKAVGFVGLGRVGSAIARRLEAFSVAIGYCGRRQENVAYRHYPAVRDLAQSSDILFVCCPGGPATHHLIDAGVLAALGPEGYLLNLSRGSVVDEAALIAALTGGTIKGAALDVYADEPNVPEALRRLDNTLLLPHLGSATHETRAAMLRLTLDNLKAVLSGKPPLTPV